MAVPYTFGSATTSIPLSQLDSNFATTITLGNTAIQLGNTVTTLNNMTLANVTISSGTSNLAATAITNGTSNVTIASSGGNISMATNGTTAITVDTSQKTTFAKSIILSGSTSGTTTLASTAVAGTSTATFPAATGTVMVSGNMPAFSAYMSGNQSVTSSTTTKLTFNTEIFDTNSNYDPTTNYRFTPTVAGYYQINAIVTANATGGTILQLNLYKNGVLYLLSDNRPTFGVLSANINDVVSMNGTTDYVEIYGYITGTSPAFFGNTTYSRFSGSLVRAS